MIRVVLFEDNKNLRESLALYLSGTEGIWFSGAFPNAKEAWPLIKKHKPDVVLMDIQMPRMDGHEAVRTLRRMEYAKPIIALTAHAMREEQERTRLSGFTEFLSKPIDKKALISTIAKHSHSKARF